jgi:anti-anti-sigma factor
MWKKLSKRLSHILRIPAAGSGRGQRRPRRFRPAVDNMEDRLVPATITVTPFADVVNPNDRATSLREAINMAKATPTERPTEGPFNFSVSEMSGGVVIRLQGEARITAVDRLQFTLARLVARRVPLVVLDLSGLTLLSSLAMGALVALSRDLGRWGGRVRIAGIRPRVYESLESLRLHTLFEFCSTIEEALSVAGGPTAMRHCDAPT